MPLKVFIPDWDGEKINRYCTPLLYPFLQQTLAPPAVVERYGSWVKEIERVNSLQACDIAILKYEIGFYFAFKQMKKLQAINSATNKAGKLLICTAKEDAGITPPLQYFHLYRWGGYASANKGNQFAMPSFITDPLPMYNNGQLAVHQQKSAKPLIGFCGQASGSLLKWSKDILRNIYNRGLKLLDIRFEDNERLTSSTYIRSQLLDALEQSPLVNTCFIRHRKYRNGATAPAAKEADAQIFFHNILHTQYTLCYRGAGNFSVRLYETMACGRIPVIVMSDNLLPLPNKIDWNRFPVIQPAERKIIAYKIAAFHNSMEEKELIALQLYARKMWEQYLSYTGFMQSITAAYMQPEAMQHSRQ